MTACHHHADKPALGRCYRCRRPICDDCAVRRRRSLDRQPGGPPPVCKLACEPAPAAPRRARFKKPAPKSDAKVTGALVACAFIVAAVALRLTVFPGRKKYAGPPSFLAPAKPDFSRVKPVPPDVSAVRVGQRYVFDHGGFREVWTIEEVEGLRVRYRRTRAKPPSGELIETVEDWAPPAWERVFKQLDAARSPCELRGVPGEVVFWHRDSRDDRYLVRGFRVAFPGLIQEQPTDALRTRRLVRIEQPR